MTFCSELIIYKLARPLFLLFTRRRERTLLAILAGARYVPSSWARAIGSEDVRHHKFIVASESSKIC